MENLPIIEPGYRQMIEEGIFETANTNFERGFEIFRQYIKLFPKNPEGYFFYSAAIQEKIQKENDLSFMPLFEKNALKVKSICKLRIARNKNDAVALLYYGAIHGYQGLLKAKQRHLLQAFISAVSAREYLEKSLKLRPDTPDAWFGLGMIYYFASRKSEEEGGMIAWTIKHFITDGVDKRKEGIALIQKSVDGGALARDYALSALMWTKLYDKKYDEARERAEEVAARFDMDIKSRWVLFRTALIDDDCVVAEEKLDQIKTILIKREIDLKRYKDIYAAELMANRCVAMKNHDYESAEKYNNAIGDWLDDDPQASIEYQDEKRLLQFFHKRQKTMARIIRREKNRPISDQTYHAGRPQESSPQAR